MLNIILFFTGCYCIKKASPAQSSEYTMFARYNCNKIFDRANNAIIESF